MTSTEKYEQFRNFLLEYTIDEMIEKYYPIRFFVSFLRTFYDDIIYEARLNCEYYIARGDDFRPFFEGLSAKIQDLKRDLFHEEVNVIILKSNGVNISGKDIRSVYAKLIYDKISNLQLHLLNLSVKSQEPNVLENKPKVTTVQPKHHQGFNFKHSIATTKVFNYLNDGFIEKTPFSHFDNNFKGETTSTTIKWKSTPNSLHYFIDKISKSIVGYSPDNKDKIKKGIWLKTAQIFTKENGNPYSNETLSHANRLPSKKDIDKLNRICDLINETKI